MEGTITDYEITENKEDIPTDLSKKKKSIRQKI